MKLKRKILPGPLIKSVSVYYTISVKDDALIYIQEL